MSVEKSSSPLSITTTPTKGRRDVNHRCVGTSRVHGLLRAVEHGELGVLQERSRVRGRGVCESSTSTRSTGGRGSVGQSRTRTDRSSPGLATLSRRDSSNHLCAVRNSLLRVERALLARETLKVGACVRVCWVGWGREGEGGERSVAPRWWQQHSR